MLLVYEHKYTFFFISHKERAPFFYVINDVNDKKEGLGSVSVQNIACLVAKHNVLCCPS